MRVTISSMSETMSYAVGMMETGVRDFPQQMGAGAPTGVAAGAECRLVCRGERQGCAGERGLYGGGGVWCGLAAADVGPPRIKVLSLQVDNTPGVELLR